MRPRAAAVGDSDQMTAAILFRHELQPSLVTHAIDIAAQREVGRTPVPDAWLGLCAAKSRNLFYVGGATKASVYELELNPETGALARTRARGSAVPAHLDLSPRPQYIPGTCCRPANGQLVAAHRTRRKIDLLFFAGQ